MKTTLALRALASALAAAPGALAERPVEDPRVEVALRGHAGMFANVGFLLGGMATVGYGALDVGGLAEVGAAVIGYEYSAIAAAVGFASRDRDAVRLSAHGVVGRHAYTGVGRGLFSVDPGAGAALAFVGLRAAAVWQVWGLDLGLFALAEADVEPVTVSYTYDDHGSVGDDSEIERTRVVGTDRYGLGLLFGYTFD